MLTGGAKHKRWSDLVEDEGEDEYEGMSPINFNDPWDDSSNDEREWEDEVDDYAHWKSFSIDPSRRENPYPAVGPLPGVRLSALVGVDSTWTVVGKINPTPLKLTHKGPSARKAVAGDGVCIGLTFKPSPFVHPNTKWNRELVAAVVAEICSHTAFDKIFFTSIQINHNTISAPHTDNNLVGAPSIAMGLGDYVGGRLRLKARNSR